MTGTDHDCGSGADDGHGHGGGSGADDGHGHGGGHDHGSPGRTSARTLALVSVINLVGFVAELAGGLLFGSVALLSDAVHMLFDALAYVMAFAAAHAAERYDRSERWSYGLHRLEPLSAFLNGILLLPMVAYVLYESYRRFLAPVDVATGPTVALALGGLAINLASVYVLGGGEMTLNERGAYYHLLGDAGGSVAVVVSTVVVEFTGIRAVDPAVAVLIAAVVLWSAGKVLRGSGEIFLGRSPVDTREVRDALSALSGVERVEDVHTWQICSEIRVATVHLATDLEGFEDVEALRREVHRALDGFEVSHATVEIRPVGTPADDRLAAHEHT